MIKQLANWRGRVLVNGTEYSDIESVPVSVLDSTTVITLIPVRQVAKQAVKAVSDKVEHIITVKPYMTKKASPEFDFMLKWNNNVPMPMRTMVGTVEKETKGMVYMKLHCELLAERTFTCMCCGRQLTNPISQFFGVGPECSGHGYELPEGYTKDELKKAVDAYKKVLIDTTWEGWVVKSSILSDVIKEG